MIFICYLIFLFLIKIRFPKRVSISEIDALFSKFSRHVSVSYSHDFQVFHHVSVRATCFMFQLQCFTYSHVFQQHVSVIATCFRFPEERALNYGSSLSSKPANRWLKFSISAETSETSAATYRTSAATFRSSAETSETSAATYRTSAAFSKLQLQSTKFQFKILKIITMICIANFNGQIYSLKLK